MKGLGLVTIVVPARNEEAGIAATLRSLPRDTLHSTGFRTEVIVLDGHSTDATRRIAERHGATVVSDRGHGKGSALREARSNFTGDFAIMLDADGTYAPDAIPRVLSLLAHGDADVVMGDRVLLGGSMSRVHRAGNALLSLGAAALYGRRVPDLCTGLWGFRTNALRQLPMRSEGFELEAELFALSARLGLRIRHTPVDYLPRNGSSKLTTRDGLRIGWSLMRNRFAALPDPVSTIGPPAPAVVPILKRRIP